MEDSSLDIVPTKAMLLKKNLVVNEFKAVVFETHKSKKSDKTNRFSQKKRSAGEERDEPGGLDMKRVRHEVFNFGISGYNFQDQQKAKVALAVKLGAKPPKNAYKNYKELQVENKEAKAKAKEEAYIRTVGKNSAGLATVSCNQLVNRFTKKTKKNKNNVGELTKHYGVVDPKIQKKKKK
ncbi:uncharacterized protein C1orf131 [Sitodiplosis mosellana]|uniref:uncharacterized protein C1orf131 n=1 Tax=Sitodiplosis mosellana TaxID=263140 RepID=UPI002443765A|nr:uncharacterized protein C1orf131 [Sitodiplosis mosellana]